MTNSTSPWAKEDDKGAFLPSQERISLMTKEFQKGWSEKERYDRIYNPELVNIGKGNRRRNVERDSWKPSLEDDPDYSWLEESYEV